MPDNNSSMLSLQVSRSVISQCGLTPALIFSRLWAFTKAGTQACFYTDKNAMSEFGLGRNTVRRAISALVNAGLVSIRQEIFEYGHRKSYTINLQAYKDLPKLGICPKRTDPCVQIGQIHVSKLDT